MPNIDLSERSGLPDALRVLLAEFPRDDWRGHENFGELVRFWLQRHLMFRDLLGRLQNESRSHFDGGSEFDRFAARLSRLGGFLLQELHMHHQIEDTQYFPQLIELDARLEPGFGILDSDHHAIEVLLQGFANAANSVLQAKVPRRHDATGALIDRLDGFQVLLDRHLTDEEDLIVPVILKSGFSG